jgi:hypothetical protein
VLARDGNPDSAHLRARVSVVAACTGEELLERLGHRVHDVIPALPRHQIAQFRMIDSRGETPRSGAGSALSRAAGGGDDVDRTSDALQTEGRQRAADEAFVE